MIRFKLKYYLIFFHSNQREVFSTNCFLFSTIKKYLQLNYDMKPSKFRNSHIFVSGIVCSILSFCILLHLIWTVFKLCTVKLLIIKFLILKCRNCFAKWGQLQVNEMGKTRQHLYRRFGKSHDQFHFSFPHRIIDFSWN